MASIKDLKKRITSVKNTQQTTKAMKMVSAAKLRRAQEAVLAQRPYAKQILELLKHAASASDAPSESPLVTGIREGRAQLEKKKVLLVLVTSDRGLCGAFNGNIVKTAQRWIKSEGENYERVELAFVGRRGYDFFKNRPVNKGPYFQDVGGKVNFIKAKKLTETLMEMYLTGQIDEVKFLYNEFKNAVSQKIVVEDFLPLPQTASEPSKDTTAYSPVYIIKPSPQEVLDLLLEKNFSIQTFRILLESQAGEHGARMSAMENATKNAGEMIRKLTLQYNKQRQAGITKELLEIISGSESQKAS